MPAELDLIVEKVKKAQKEYSTFSQNKVNKIFQAAAIAASRARIELEIGRAHV